MKCLVNKRRAAKGRKPLKRQASLARAATNHTRQMQRRNCFQHTCPGGPDLIGRITRTRYLPCGCNWGARENLAWGQGKGMGSPGAIVKAWMKSPEHRANILARDLEHIGVGFRRGSPFKGKRSYGTYTVNFGYRR